MNNSETDLNKLHLFINAWKQLPTNQDVEETEQQIISVNSLKDFITSFEPAMDSLRSSGVQANVWDVAGLKRDEVRISSVLNWFLDPIETHGQGTKICESLLNKVHQKNHTNISDTFPKAQDLGKYRASVEVCPSGHENRVDIVLDGEDLLLYIEVKIDASQGEEQLQRYHYLAENNANGRKWGVVYLTSNGKIPDDAPSNNCIPIRWSDVAEVFSQHERKLKYNHLSRHYIGQFAQYVSKF